MIDNYTFYKSFYDATLLMNDKDRLAFYDALSTFFFEDKEPNITGTPHIVFMAIKPVLAMQIKSRIAGKKGGEKSRKNNPPYNEKITPLKNKNKLKERKGKERIGKDSNVKDCKGGDCKDGQRYVEKEPIQEWIDYRKSIKKPISEASIKKLYKRYEKDPNLFMLSVEYSIENGYQGLFEPKSTQQTGDHRSKQKEAIAKAMAELNGDEDVIDAVID